MNTSVLFAGDLDLTLLYSQRGVALGDGPVGELVTVEHLDGRPLSFMTAQALELLGEVCAACLFVPVTSRTLAQYQRIHWAGRLPTPRWAVTSNGGRVLRDGRVDTGWSAGVRATLAACLPVAEVAARFARFVDAVGDGWVDRVRCADGLFLYAIVDVRRIPAELDALRADLAAAGWLVSRQGRKLYLTPEALDKRAAVCYVRDGAGAERLVAAGDSLLDMTLLEAADVAVRPAHGELYERGWTGTPTTRASGPRAAEEILTAVLAGIPMASSVRLRTARKPPVRGHDRRNARWQCHSQREATSP